MRVIFVEEGGMDIIQEYLNTDEVDIIEEVLYNIEDLIYVRLTFNLFFRIFFFT